MCVCVCTHRLHGSKCMVIDRVELYPRSKYSSTSCSEKITHLFKNCAFMYYTSNRCSSI